MFVVHVAEKLRQDEQVVAQVNNNTREQALKGDLPNAALQAIAGAMTSHRTLARDLLRSEHDGRRELLFGLLYDLLLNPEQESALLRRDARS